MASGELTLVEKTVIETVAGLGVMGEEIKIHTMAHNSIRAYVVVNGKLHYRQGPSVDGAVYSQLRYIHE